MIIEEFEALCTTNFDELFHRAKNTDDRKFLTCFFTFYQQDKYNIMSYITDYEFGEVLDLLQSLNIPKDNNEIDNKTKTRIRLLIYSHILEVDFVYMVIFNLIRTINGLNYSPQISFITKKGDIKTADYPSEKIDLINKESKKINLNFGDIFYDFWDRNLRNSFNHSQYFTFDNGGLEISKYLSPTSSKFQKSGKTMYSYIEIENKYNRCRIFIKTFINTYNIYIEPYTDGKPYDTIFGPILYSQEHGWNFNQ